MLPSEGAMAAGTTGVPVLAAFARFGCALIGVDTGSFACHIDTHGCRYGTHGYPSNASSLETTSCPGHSLSHPPKPPTVTPS